MAIPPEIRAVERPTNTIICDSHTNGPHRYSVRERAKAYGHSKPRNGRIVGHIIEGKYVPLERDPAAEDEEVDDIPARVAKATPDVMEDLLVIYYPELARKIMALAALKVMKPGILNGRPAVYYNKTSANRHYPGLSMTQKDVADFLEKVGKNQRAMQAFFDRRPDAEKAKKVALERFCRETAPDAPPILNENCARGNQFIDVVAAIVYSRLYAQNAPSRGEGTAS